MLKYYIIPKTEWEVEQYKIKSTKDLMEKFEDYEINEITKKEIEKKISEINFENNTNYFKRLKPKDFIFAITEILEIGNIKASNTKLYELYK